MGSAQNAGISSYAGFVASGHRAAHRMEPSWLIVSAGAVVLAGVLLVKSALIGRDLWAGIAAPELRGFHPQLSMAVLAFHVFTASTALLIGVLQLTGGIRFAHPRLHRGLGRTYVVLVLLTAVASLGLSTPLNVFGTAFLRVLAGLIWPTVTLLGVAAALRGDLQAHRRWMLRSFAFASMGMTFMLCTWIGNGLHAPFVVKYPASIWISMFGNLLIAELIARRVKIKA